MREDRHGRVARADNDPRRRPADGFRLRDEERFAGLTEDALADLPDPLADVVAAARLIVTDVPPPAVADALALDIPLAAFRAAAADQPAEVTVYRRPLEARAASRADLQELVRLAVGHEVADVLGIDVDLDDDDWDE